MVTFVKRRCTWPDLRLRLEVDAMLRGRRQAQESFKKLINFMDQQIAMSQQIAATQQRARSPRDDS